MLLTSFVFLIFCIITLLVYFIVPKKFQWFVLLISSVFFLFYNNLHIATIIQALMILIPSYIFGRLIEKNYDTKKAKLFLVIRNINNCRTTGMLKIYKFIYNTNK